MRKTFTIKFIGEQTIGSTVAETQEGRKEGKKGQCKLGEKKNKQKKFK
jgi:hypothetical protein